MYLEHLNLISGQLMPSNVIEYCTPHDRLTKVLVILGKLIQQRHNMGHTVHAVQSYFRASLLKTELLAFKSIADYHFMYSYSAENSNPSITLFVFFPKNTIRAPETRTALPKA